MSNTKGAATPPKLGRVQQFKQAYDLTRRTDKLLPLWLLGSFLLGAAVGGVLMWLIPPSGGWLDITLTVFGALMFGTMAALLVFSRRAQASVYDQMDGRMGAAGAMLQGTLRRGWKTDLAVAFTKQQDVVHRVVGPPGIVLVGEGNVNRLRPLMTTERRKLERVVAETPVHEIVVGDAEGQIPLRQVVKSVTKLPKAVKPAQMTDILSRLKAFDATRSSIPLPKGPVPTSMKGLRGNLRGR